MRHTRMIRPVDWRAIAIVSAFVLQVCFFTPLQIFLNNVIEFSANFAQLLLLFLLVSSGLIGIFYLTAGKFSSQIFLAAVTFLSVVVFIESRIFFSLAGHRPFDGNVIDWEPLSTLSNVELATILALTLLFAVLRRRQELFYSVSLFILLFHSCGFLHSTITRWDGIQQSARSAQDASAYFSDFFRLSRERNVIHIVPDHTQSSLVYEILTSDRARYEEVFDGFTLFTHAAGRYPSTYPSILFYMTGRGPNPDMDVVASLPFTHEYIRKTLKEHSIVNSLAASGFKTFAFPDTGLWTEGAYTAYVVQNPFEGRPPEEVEGNTSHTFRKLLDVSLFQVTPIPVRRHIYNDEQWLLTRLFVKTHSISGVLELFIENLATDERPGSYNYFHHAGGHPPIQFNENCNYVGTQKWNHENTRAQVTCTLLQLERLVQKLKQLGIYDQTMIIMNGDHGSQWRTPLMSTLTGAIVPPRVMSSANPVVLAKPPRTRGHLRFSRAPVSIGDVPATISDAFGLDGQFPGISMFQLSETAIREREYLWYKPRAEIFTEQALPLTSRYRIRGDIFNQYDWIPPYPHNLEEAPAALTMDHPHPHNLEEAPAALTMDHPRFSRFAMGFSTLARQERPMRWVVGNHARVHLSFPTEGGAQLRFDTYVPPTIAEQSVAVSINGKSLTKLDEQELAGSRRHVISLPDDLPRKNVNTIEFAMGKTVRIGSDSRELSVVFTYVGLEPLE